MGSLKNTSHTTAYGGVGFVLSYTGLVGRGRVGVSPTPSTNTVILPTSKSLCGGRRRWSAACSSKTPPGYVARAWFTYRAASPGQPVLRTCSTAGALLWRDVADPGPISRRVSPLDRGGPDQLDVRHSIQCPKRAASGPMSPGSTASTIRCIAASSVGAPALFRARMAGRAASPRKVLALPAGLCSAAVCASGASVTASATRLQTIASCARRPALACSGLFPLRQGMVLWALQSAAAGGGQGSNTCHRCATDVGSRRRTRIHRTAAPAGPAWPCQAVCASRMHRCKASPSVRLRKLVGGSGQGHTTTLEHRAHLLAPIGAAEDTGSHSPQRWQMCGRVGGRRPGAETAEPEVVSPLAKGVPDL